MIEKIIKVLKKERKIINDDDFFLWADDEDLLALANKLEQAINFTDSCVMKRVDNEITFRKYKKIVEGFNAEISELKSNELLKRSNECYKTGTTCLYGCQGLCK
tara:strand:- start:414 stop:725 length:312 start_codon:yes stop_codon:yes gene_type:complete